jgi:hypothetical protein
VLRAYNETHPAGVTATFTVRVVEHVRFVSATSARPQAPYASWATAARNVQDAIDAATVPGGLVLVSNGVYQTGGREADGVTNRVVINKPLTIRSVNGPEATVIHGGGVMRCVSLASSAALEGFSLIAGFANTGGGVWCRSTNEVVSNCIVSSNSAQTAGGGAFSGTLNNCALTGNTSARDGGGAYSAILNNCTVTDNLAHNSGGGVSSCILNNSIAWFNTLTRGSGPANHDVSTFNYSCTTPLPTSGSGNIADNPQLASFMYLSAGSPCRGAGSAAFIRGVDIDGEPWASPPSIGCDEHHLGGTAGPISVGIDVSYKKVALGIGIDFRARISGQVGASQWDFGGTILSNQPSASHSWATTGSHVVVLRALNETYPQGVSATVTVQVVERPVHYVSIGSPNPVPPYESWATATANIQAAIDVAAPGSLVLVNNGVYQSGARDVENGTTYYGWARYRVAVMKPVTVQSVNGPATTTILGEPSVGGVYLANKASLMGFTVTNGSARSGGGVRCESATAVVSNCVITGNRASFSGGGVLAGTLIDCTLADNDADYSGGGAAGATLVNCRVFRNVAYSRSDSKDGSSTDGDGGGVSFSTLNNCTLAENRANRGGGAYSGTLNNCIVYFNTAETLGPNHHLSVMNYSCTTPLPANGVANITRNPEFIDRVAVNLRLGSNSPCINAGHNAHAPVGKDLDGNPRIVGGTIDMGPYEFQSPRSTISYAWLQQFGLPIDGFVDGADPDHDRFSNDAEWRAGTDPKNAASVLRLRQPMLAGLDLVVTWESVFGRSYALEASSDLTSSTSFHPVASNIPGRPGTTSFTHRNSASQGPRYYRVSVEE